MIYEYWSRYKHGDVVSTDFRSVCRACETLTFDPRSRSGFAEVEMVRGPGFENQSNVTVRDCLNDVAMDLVLLLKDSIRRSWDPSEHHTVFMSGGHDSQILMLCLQSLARSGFDLGEILTITLEPEHDIASDFVAANLSDLPMKHEVWRAEAVTEPDYYDIRFEHNTNAFHHPFLCCFPDYLPTRSIFVSGVAGGELLSYPSSKQTQVPPRNGSYPGGFDYFMRTGTAYTLGVLANWNGLVTPYLDTEYMSYVFGIRPDLFMNDQIRVAMLRVLGCEKIRAWVGHTYNLEFSVSARSKANSEYLGSRFYEDFSDHWIVMKSLPFKDLMAEITIKSFSDIGFRLYGLATMYEGV